MSDKPESVPLEIPDKNVEDTEYATSSHFVRKDMSTPNPSFLETAGANFRQYNDVYRGISWLSNITKNPYRSDYDEGYNPVTSGLLDQVPDNIAFKNRIFEAKTKEEGEQVVKRIHEELADNEISNRSGFWANITTMGTAAVLSPTTLFAIGQTAKYASISKSLFQGAIQGAKVTAIPSALQNAILIGTKETKDIHDWAIDTMIDTFMGTSLGGVIGTFAGHGVQKELKNAKSFFKAVDEDVGIKINVGENGEAEGLKAFSTGGGSAGAMKVDKIQELLDSGTVSFRENKVIKNTLGYAQPIIAMLTDRFAIVNRFGDMFFSHNFEVAGKNVHNIKDPSAENFTRLARSTYENLNIMTKQHYHDFLGFKAPGKTARASIGEWSGKWMAEEEFFEHVGQAIRRNGEYEAVPEAGIAAKKWIDEQYEPLWKELKKLRPGLEDHDYTNISRYLNRVYHKGKIQETPDQFVKDLEEFLTESNAKIEARQKPIDDLKAEIKRTRGASAKNQLKANLSKLENQLQKDIKEGNIGLELLKEKPQLSTKQIADIESLQKPINEAREAWKNAKGEEKKLAKQKLDSLKAELSNNLSGGKIDRDLISTTKSGRQKLKDISNVPKLRKTLSPLQIRQAAQQTMETILHENEEQMVGRIFNSVSSGGNNVLKSRTVLWNDKLAERWLVNDIRVVGGLYMDQMSKRIHADKIFNQFDINAEEGMKGMVRLLKEENNRARDKILKNPDSPERRKELNALAKDLKKAENLMTDGYKVFMGNYVDKDTKIARTTNGIKQFTAAATLGNVPILQLTEFFSPMFKFTFSEYIFDGLVPALKRMSYIAKERVKEWRGGNVELIRGAFADAGLGNNMANAARMESLFGYGTQYQPKTLVERYVNNLANVTMQVNLSNAISDFQETIVSFSSQSKLIRTLKRYDAGEKLLDHEVAYLDILRVNPEKWGKRILQQMASHGEEVDGAFVANSHKWNDFEASQIFRIGIEKDVRSVITKPNLLDTPFGARDPITSLLFQFYSWTFAATLNFGLPTMTAPDKQKFIGILLMMASGSMTGPLRQLSRGEEPDLSFKSLAISAMTNSGFFGWPWEAIQKLNAGIDMPLLRPFQDDRFRKKDAAGLIGGPSMGMASSTLSILSALANNEFNQKDAEKSARFAAPFFFNWYLRKPTEDVIKSWGLPENRQKAKKLKDAE